MMNGTYPGTYINIIVTNTDFISNMGIDGGGIYSEWSNIIGSNLQFLKNNATRGGGFNVDNQAQFIFDIVTFDSNRADEDGGAMYQGYLCSAMISRATFSNNIAGGDGGAMWIASAIDQVSQSTYSFNIANGNGGAVYISYNGGGFHTNGCTFTSNVAGIFGGHVDVDNGGSSFNTNSSYTNGTADSGGAFGILSESIVTVTSCSIMDNVANSGGAFYLEYQAKLTLDESVVTGNNAYQRGGGIYCGDSDVIFQSDSKTTLYGNTSPEDKNFHCSTAISYTSCTVTDPSDNYHCDAAFESSDLSERNKLIIILCVIFGVVIIGVIGFAICWVKTENFRKEHGLVFNQINLPGDDEQQPKDDD